jgi:hypothetical protein
MADDEKRRVLFTAVRLNRADVIKAVATGVAEGYTNGSSTVDVDLLNSLDETQHFTALHAAVQGAALDALRMLLRLGADVTVQDASHHTAVQHAWATPSCADARQIFISEAVQSIAGNNTAQLERLLQAGLPSDAEFGSSDTPSSLLAWAQQVDNAAAVDLLRQHSAATSAGDGDEAVAAPAASSSASTAELAAAAAAPIREHPLDSSIAECRQSIASMLAEQQRVEADVAERGTDGVLRMLRETQRSVSAAYASLDEQDNELQLCLDAIAECRTVNEALQRDIQHARLARSTNSSSSSSTESSSSTHGFYRRGDRVLYVRTNPDISSEAEVLHVHAEDPADLYYTVKLLDSGQEKNTTAKYLQRIGTATSVAAASVAAAVAASSDAREQHAATAPAATASATAATVAAATTADRHTEEKQALLEQLLTMAGDIEDELHATRTLIKGGAASVVRRITQLKADGEEAAATAKARARAVAVASHQLAGLREHSEMLAALLKEERALAQELPVQQQVLQQPQQQQQQPDSTAAVAAAAAAEQQSAAGVAAAHLSADSSSSDAAAFSPLRTSALAGARRGGSLVVSAYDDASLKAALALKAEQDSSDQGFWQGLLNMLFGMADDDLARSSTNPIILA